MIYLLKKREILALMACVLSCAPLLRGQDARTFRAQAETESNQEKQVMLLCKAADLDPKNKEYRKDCDISKAALIAADRQSLKTAQDANDAGQPTKAKRYAKYVSSLDADLHHQAEQLLAKLNSVEATPATATAATTQTAGPNQTGLLNQATAAYQSGNLQAAKATAQSITDPSLKSAAGQILTDIDRYSALVTTGQHHEQAKEYAEAERSYQSALGINPHVAADDLAGKAQRMHQSAAGQVASAASSPKAPTRTPPPHLEAVLKVPEVSPEEKKKRLLDESASAMSHNDLDTAGRKFKQLLDLDPANAEAKRGIAEITAALNRDPIRLEQTLREGVRAFYASHFDDAESRFNRYLGADGGKKKGAAYFYLGATEATLAMLDDASKRSTRNRQAKEDFKQARLAGYQPLEKYVSAKVLGIWASSGL